jgi:DNA primase
MMIDFPAIRAANRLSSVVRRYVKLERAGAEWRACCPFHPDRTPSFTINDAKGFAHCFGCGWHGDVLDFISAIETVQLQDALQLLNAAPATIPQAEPPKERETEAEALRIWLEGIPLIGTPAEAYLRSRGIVCRLPDTLRFSRLHYGKRGRLHPCLIALVTSADGQPRGIQRTYLTESGTGKAAVPKPKLSLGRISGGAIRLAPAARELVLCEGLEDGLTLQQELGQAVWVAAGVGNLKKMRLPIGARSIVIGADGDAAGERGAMDAAARFAAEGRQVRVIRPLSGFKDFNAELQAGVA